MTRWLWNGVRLGLNTGVLCGATAGLIAAMTGSLLTTSLPDLKQFVGTAFLLTSILLPLLFSLSLLGTFAERHERDSLVPFTAVAVLPAVATNFAAFMMPVVMVPLMLNRGVTFADSGAWYAEVADVLVGWRLLLVAVGSAIGFAAAAYTVRANR